MPRTAAMGRGRFADTRLSSCNVDGREHCEAQDRRSRAAAWRRRFADGTRTALRDRGVDPYRNESPAFGASDDHGVAFVATIGLAAFALAAVLAHHEPDALADLPAPERRALLDRTLDNLALCARHDEPGLRAFCGEQSTIARRLPECDAPCRSLARDHYPTRSPSALP